MIPDKRDQHAVAQRRLYQSAYETRTPNSRCLPLICPSRLQPLGTLCLRGHTGHIRGEYRLPNPWTWVGEGGARLPFRLFMSYEENCMSVGADGGGYSSSAPIKM